MPVGRVKWYDKSKGYGFIESPEGDVFFHFSDILMEGFKALAEDQRVSYKLFRGDQGLKAKQIRPLDNRASVRHAARYRTLILLRPEPDKMEQFDRFLSETPSWLDSMEQDLGLRRIGTWRSDDVAIHLVESDRPYEQSLDAARALPVWSNYAKWQEDLRSLLIADPVVMAPVQPEPVGDLEEVEPSNQAAHS